MGVWVRWLGFGALGFKGWGLRVSLAILSGAVRCLAVLAIVLAHIAG